MPYKATEGVEGMAGCNEYTLRLHFRRGLRHNTLPLVKAQCRFRGADVHCSQTGQGNTFTEPGCLPKTPNQPYMKQLMAGQESQDGG